MRVDGRSVLVTGASGGIGQAIARNLHARGARLLLSGRRTDVLEALGAELGERVEAVPADLSQRADVAALAQRAAEVDVLVANAALPASGHLLEFSREEIDRALDVNLRAPVQLARALVPGMVARGSGHLVFLASLAGKSASAGSALYSATKFGVRGFALGLRGDLHGTGVGVTTVFPGFVRGAGMFAEADVRLPRGVGTRTPEQVAQAVVRGIERGRAEIDVAPLGLRVGTTLGSLAPVTAARVQRQLGSARIANATAEGQRDKR
jgi:uncharacterized protein